MIQECQTSFSSAAVAEATEAVMGAGAVCAGDDNRERASASSSTGLSFHASGGTTSSRLLFIEGPD